MKIYWLVWEGEGGDEEMESFAELSQAKDRAKDLAEQGCQSFVFEMVGVCVPAVVWCGEGGFDLRDAPDVDLRDAPCVDGVKSGEGDLQ